MRNRLEEKVAKTLPAQYEYEAYSIPYTVTHQYIPDFVDHAAKQIVEVKGRFTAIDRKKHLAIKQQQPQWRVTIVFQNPDAPITKGSKTTYAGWCDKHGIAWSKA